MPTVRYMIDASHNLKDPIEDLIQATDQIQLHARAGAARRPRRPAARRRTPTTPRCAAEVLHGAYRTDVRPLVAEARRRNGAALVAARPRSAGSATAPRSSTARGDDAVATGL